MAFGVGEPRGPGWGGRGRFGLAVGDGPPRLLARRSDASEGRVGEPAGDLPAGTLSKGRRVGGAALVHLVDASRVEAAARRRAGGIWNLARERLRQSAETTFLRGRGLDQTAEVHDGGPVRHVMHDPEAMGDEQHADVEFVGQPA